MVRVYSDIELANLQNLGWKFIRDDNGQYSFVLINDKGFCVGTQQSDQFRIDIEASEEPDNAGNPT